MSAQVPWGPPQTVPCPAQLRFQGWQEPWPWREGQMRRVSRKVWQCQGSLVMGVSPASPSDHSLESPRVGAGLRSPQGQRIELERLLGYMGASQAPHLSPLLLLCGQVHGVISFLVEHPFPPGHLSRLLGFALGWCLWATSLAEGFRPFLEMFPVVQSGKVEDKRVWNPCQLCPWCPRCPCSWPRSLLPAAM